MSTYETARAILDNAAKTAILRSRMQIGYVASFVYNGKPRNGVIDKIEENYFRMVIIIDDKEEKRSFRFDKMPNLVSLKECEFGPPMVDWSVSP